MLNKARHIGWLIAVGLLWNNVFAREIVVVDESGHPLNDVVVQFASQGEPVVESAAVVDQIDKQFVPHVIAIQKGRQVVFPNSDHIRHHVYSFSAAKTFEIKLYAGDDIAPVTFDKAGIVVLGCNIHDSMIGYIYVYDEGIAYVTGDDGRVSVPDGDVFLTLWHPRLNVDHTVQQTVQLAANANQLTLSLARSSDNDKSREADTSFGQRRLTTR